MQTAGTVERDGSAKSAASCFVQYATPKETVTLTHATTEVTSPETVASIATAATLTAGASGSVRLVCYGIGTGVRVQSTMTELVLPTS